MRILQDGIVTGAFRPVNAKIAMLGFLGMLNWTHQWFSPGGDLSPQEIAALLSDLCLYGMVARPQEREQGQQRDDGTRG